jgi:hypothetical protein
MVKLLPAVQAFNGREYAILAAHVVARDGRGPRPVWKSLLQAVQALLDQWHHRSLRAMTPDAGV